MPILARNAYGWKMCFDLKKKVAFGVYVTKLLGITLQTKPHTKDLQSNKYFH